MEKNGEVRSTWKYMLWGMDHCKFRFSLSLAGFKFRTQWYISRNLRAGSLVWDCLYSIVSLVLLYGKGIGDGVQQCLDGSNLSFCLPLHVFMRSDKIEACRSCKGPMVGLKIEKPGNWDVETISDRTWLNLVPGIPWQDQCRADLADYLRQTWCPCQSETRCYMNCGNACKSLRCLMLLGRFAFYACLILLFVLENETLVGKLEPGSLVALEHTIAHKSSQLFVLLLVKGDHFVSLQSKEAVKVVYYCCWEICRAKQPGWWDHRDLWPAAERTVISLALMDAADVRKCRV